MEAIFLLTTALVLSSHVFLATAAGPSVIIVGAGFSGEPSKYLRIFRLLLFHYFLFFWLPARI